jgi:hypothetical protein
MSSLYNLTAEYQLLLAKDTYTDEDMQRLDLVYEDFQDKCIAVATVIKEMEARQKSIDEAIKEMKERSSKLGSKIESLELYLKESMIKANIDKVDKSPYFDIKVKTNPEKLIETGSVIAAEWYVKKESYELDKNLVKDALRRGIEIPGAALVQEKRVEIK